MNNIVIVGRLGADVEASTVTTKAGDEIVLGKFTVAVNDPMSKTEDVDWIKCRQFRCDNLEPYLTKGKLVSVQGRLKTDSYVDTEGKNRVATYILVERTELLSDSRKDANEFTERVDKKEPSANTNNNKKKSSKSQLNNKKKIEFKPVKLAR